MARHLQGVGGEERLLAGELGDRFHHIGQRIERPPRQAHRRRFPPAQAGDLGQHVAQGHVLAAQDVALADPALLQRQPVALGDVVHVHQIEASLHEGRHLAGGGFHDDPSGRRGAYVARADRGGGADDHRRQPLLGDHGFHPPLGDHLAALVGADGVGFRQGRSLVGGDALQAQGGDAGGIDHPLHARGQGGLHHRFGPRAVVADDLLRIARPQAIIGGHVQQPADALHGGGHVGRAAHVAGDHLGLEALQIAPRALGAGQDPHRDALGLQGPRDGRADEARGAGDQGDVH